MYRKDIDEKIIPAYEALADGNVKKAEELALPFLNSARDLQKKQSAIILAGCKFRSRDFDGALKHLQAIDTLEDKEAMALSAVSLVKLGKIDEADVRFAKAMALEQGTHGYLTCDLLMVYFRSLCDAGDLVKIKKYIHEFVQVYTSVKISDPHFLIVREIPPFEDFLAEVKKAVNNGYREIDKKEWQNLYSEIDEEGKKSLKDLFDFFV